MLKTKNSGVEAPLRISDSKLIINQDDSEDENDGRHDDSVPEFEAVKSMDLCLSRFYDGTF
jgi:hypothetical protein